VSKTGGPQGDLWSWDGANWTVLSTSQPAPEARYNALMAYSPYDSGLLLYGGITDSAYAEDTWVFYGTSWRLIPSAPSPGVSTGAGMVDDVALNALVLVSGSSTWTWGGQ
jgi:hypothetical protein